MSRRVYFTNHAICRLRERFKVWSKDVAPLIQTGEKEQKGNRFIYKVSDMKFVTKHTGYKLIVITVLEECHTVWER